MAEASEMLGGVGVERGIERLPEPVERHPELGSVLSPSSGHYPTANTANTRLAPIFTLDELLGQFQEGDPTLPVPEGNARGTVDSPPARSEPIPIPTSAGGDEAGPSTGVAARRQLARPLSSALSSEIESARRTWQGGIEAAERLGYDPTRPQIPGRRGIEPTRLPIRPTNHADAPPRPGIRERERVNNLLAENAGPVERNTPIPIRRRPREEFMRNLGLDPATESGMDEEVELDDGDIQFWASIGARRPPPVDGLSSRRHVFQDNNEPRPPREPRVPLLTQRITRPFYSHPNLTGDIDLDEWSGAFGLGPGLGSASILRRGGNNRRRDSLQQRVDPGRDLSGGAEEVMPLLADMSQGLEPTNMENLSIHHPTIVRSSNNVNSTRRQRSASDGATPDRRTPFPKRRKVPTDPALPPTRPAYLSMTSISPSTPLPDDFDKPTKKSFLSLSHSTTGRALIKFCDGPRVTETDDDACALRANRPIPYECGVYYYEVECINAGLEGFMSVGWMLRTTGLQRLVGWDKGTWGWHADDGMSFNQSGSGEEFAERWSSELVLPL